MEKLYTVEQIAKILSMHPKTIQRYIREGKINATKVGKSWRVTGHDLSLFTESNNYSENKTHSISKGSMEDRVKISAVVDIDINDMDEGIRIVNMLTAVLNAKTTEYGKSTMNAQFIEPEQKVRVMLWGSIKFMENILSSLSVLTDPQNNWE